MVSKAKLGVGSRIWWKGEAWSITGLFAGAVELVGDRGRTVRADSASLVGTEDYQVLKEFTGAPSASEEDASTLPTGKRENRGPVRRQLLNESKPSRPGDVVLIDSAPLGFYAVDPLTFRWVPVQLSVAMDLYSRSILACRFTPASSKPLDAALLLYDVVLPQARSTGVLSSARLPYAGVPQSVIVELERDEDLQRNFSRLPFFKSHSIREDHVRVTLSERFNEACLRLDTGVQLNRPNSLRSGGLARRLFKAIREEFVENLPGYKGPDLLSRREDAENETFHFLDEVENSFTEWVMSDWQQRPRKGLKLPWASSRNLSPNDMYYAGLERAGYLEVVAGWDQNVELLPAAWRNVHEQGIELAGLIYDDQRLDQYREVPSRNDAQRGRYPLRFDPRDLSKVYFFDPETHAWIAIGRRSPSFDRRPFDETTLAFAKGLVVARGGNMREQDELNRTVEELLDRVRPFTPVSNEQRRLAALEAMRNFKAADERARLSRGRCFWTRHSS